jgi:hypothetical protein
MCYQRMIPGTWLTHRRCCERPSGGRNADLLLYCGEARTCLVEGEKIRSEGGCFRSVFVEVGGQGHSRVGEREIGTK